MLFTFSLCLVCAAFSAVTVFMSPGQVVKNFSYIIMCSGSCQFGDLCSYGDSQDITFLKIKFYGLK